MAAARAAEGRHEEAPAPLSAASAAGSVSLCRCASSLSLEASLSHESSLSEPSVKWPTPAHPDQAPSARVPTLRRGTPENASSSSSLLSSALAAPSPATASVRAALPLSRRCRFAAHIYVCVARRLSAHPVRHEPGPGSRACTRGFYQAANPIHALCPKDHTNQPTVSGPECAKCGTSQPAPPTPAPL